MVIGAVLLVSACAGKEEPVETTPAPAEEEQPAVEQAPTEGVQVEPEEVGPTPGSQEDLDQTAGALVYFGFDRYDLTADARSVLQSQARWIIDNNASVTIEGHCDERGTREYNLALGDRRATAVKNYLVALGVSASQIRTVSYGKERPAVSGSGESVWAQNRRGYTRVE
ncbi:peptidoglycan-associated lipoprotein Pal [Emcibacter nanhaiensis]|uniref:Peptidoglycan-associated protein n=2 Tax=Emcibacter nanhaiensis TaxID=1505037 RepID=A0A501PNL0_9PROT|nr:peptidoglycan-associated lipoprotein Pal [Emcibacter nanhaiensis]